MNKKLDWFKFSATDWLSGSVQLLSDGEKGTFIDLIAMIWKEQGSITVNNILYRKLRIDNATACERIKSYCELGILVMRDDKLSIKFLDNQMSDIETTSKKNSENAKKRWDKKKVECDRMPIREEKKREEKIRTDNKKENNKQLESSWEIFWNDYPKKTNNVNAKKTLFKYLKQGVTIEQICEAMNKSEDLRNERQYIPNPQAWLNKAPWLDEEFKPMEGQQEGLSLAERMEQRK